MQKVSEQQKHIELCAVLHRFMNFEFMVIAKTTTTKNTQRRCR